VPPVFFCFICQLFHGLWRKTSHSQLVDKKFNSFSAKGFSEDVCQLILGIEKVKLYYSVLNLLFYEVESEIENVEHCCSIRQ
ncbi:hypothetical protein Tco_0403107, partial [Tanacetum coccineum]